MRHVRAHVLICAGTGCVSSGSKAVETALIAELEKRGLDKEIKVIETGCHGFCEMGPIMIVYPEGVFYSGVKESDVYELVEEHLLKGRIVERLLYKDPVTLEKIPNYQDMNFYKKQMRLVLSNCGHISPENINEYIGEGGYEALSKVLSGMSQEEVIDEIKKSGLRGRGGGGFPTGMKWEFAHKAAGDKKYIVCNADEGDPGAFMDRSILEGDPHRLIEGMTICAYAIGSDEGYVYARAEYPLAVARLKIAIAQAEEMSLLGDNIL
ncbi:MAG: NADH-quinone oxidoreductase subunit F, partial [Clostridiaceae bacterium]|nr:NADH-quinone oxidoreductase subunit F [Clostridiaceae bacterium]